MRKNTSAKQANKLAETLVTRGRELYSTIFRAQSIHFYRLIGVAVFLTVFGIVMVLSASSIDSLKANNNSFTIGGKQLIFGILGFIALSIISLAKPAHLEKLSKLAFQVTMLLQIAVFFIGQSVNGNRNWINLGFTTIQPSEFLKMGMILYGAHYLSKRVDNFHEGQTWAKTAMWGLLAMAAVFVGSDLGTVLIMFIFYFGMLILAGMPNRLIIALVGLAAVGISMALTIGSSRMGRILAWMNPTAPDPNGYNWQAEHGMWALSAGQIFGAGLGESKMKWSWIPEVENDFIFAIIGEELGLIGALVILGTFLFLAVCLNNILRRTHDLFGRYVVSGVMIWITFQALVNIAVVLRLLPVLGVPLPFVSAGGSSLLSSLMGIGIVLAIERDNHAHESSRGRASLRPVRIRR